MTTYDDILKANATLKPIDVKGKQYAPVTERIKAFRMIHPEGGISTEIVSIADGVCVIRAIVTTSEGQILGTGTAYEKESSSYINKTSYIENCETSAVGRALGMAGYGIDGSMASAEELLNAVKQQEEMKKAEAADAEALKTHGPDATNDNGATLQAFAKAKGLKAADINGWRVKAIHDGVIPDMKWPAMTKEQIGYFMDYVEAQLKAGG